LNCCALTVGWRDGCASFAAEIRLVGEAGCEPLVGFRARTTPSTIAFSIASSPHPRHTTHRRGMRQASSLITEVEAGRGVALSSTIFKLVRQTPALRPLTGTTEVASVGIARASKGDVNPLGRNLRTLAEDSTNECGNQSRRVLNEVRAYHFTHTPEMFRQTSAFHFWTAPVSFVLNDIQCSTSSHLYTRCPPQSNSQQRKPEKRP